MLNGSNDFMYNIAGPEDISEERKEELLSNLAREVVERELTAPAILFLETIKPLSFVGSQIMVMANPFIQILFQSRTYWEITMLLEDRDNLEYLIQEIERRANGEETGTE